MFLSIEMPLNFSNYFRMILQYMQAEIMEMQKNQVMILSCQVTIYTLPFLRSFLFWAHNLKI